MTGVWVQLQLRRRSAVEGAEAVNGERGGNTPRRVRRREEAVAGVRQLPLRLRLLKEAGESDRDGRTALQVPRLQKQRKEVEALVLGPRGARQCV
jgi:hypothetical protein